MVAPPTDFRVHYRVSLNKQYPDYLTVLRVWTAVERNMSSLSWRQTEIKSKLWYTVETIL